MSITRSLAVALGLCLVAPLAAPPSAGALPADPDPAAQAAYWLTTQQQADGGFEVAGYPGFETPDVVFALAQAAQDGPRWDTGRAASAVASVTTDGHDALDALDALVDGEAEPDGDAAGARAAKLIALVALPLGLDPHDFDPADDSPSPVDLVARMDLHRQGDGSYDFGAQFNGTLFAAIARSGLGEDVPAGLVAQIRAAQRSDGSWDYTGTPDGGPGDDVDTTALALLALAGDGLTPADGAVGHALFFLAGKQSASGAWPSFGTDDPNSTAIALQALAALHVDVRDPAWPVAVGLDPAAPVGDPYAWLVAQQVVGGRIASPNDEYGTNTFATSQAVQALTRQWYLRDARGRLLDRWSRTLASPAAAPATGHAEDLASDALGPNSADGTRRTVAAGAVVNGPDGRLAAADDLFEQVFGRATDPSGGAWWADQLRTISRPEMLARLVGTGEFAAGAGATAADQVDTLYRTVLQRPADPGGKAYWVARLEAGTPWRTVARKMIASDEFRRGAVTTAYQRTVERAPGADALAYWAQRIGTTRIEVLYRALGGSSEFYAMGAG